VLGGIYRISPVGAKQKAIQDPRGQSIDWVKADARSLANLLGDSRPAVRSRAIESLAAAPERLAAIDELRKVAEAGEMPDARRNALWTLARLDEPEAREPARKAAANDPDETVRQVATHTISLRRDAGAMEALLSLLQNPSAANRRVAAEAIGRIGDAKAVPALLQAAAAAGTSDRVLTHSITYALIEIGDATSTAAGLSSNDPATIRAALVALDQMDGGGLDPSRVASLLASTDPVLKETASWIVGRHPEWAEALAGSFRERLTSPTLADSDSDRSELEAQLARFAGSPAIQTLLIERAGDSDAPKEERLSALRAMSQSGLKSMPASWLVGLARLVGQADAEIARMAIGVARAVPAAPDGAAALAERLLAIANEAEVSEVVRLEALAAMPGGLSKVSPGLFGFLIGQIDHDQAVVNRSLAADVLTRAKLAPEQLAGLAAAIGTAGPLEINRLLAIFAEATDDPTGQALIASLSNSAAVSSLRVETLRPNLAKFGPVVQKDAETLYARLDADAAKQRARLEQMLTSLSAGDVRRGQVIFHSEKAACYSCHAIGYRGGKVGPDLTRIGQVRAERDLLEAIVFPSASFVRSFEPIVVATADGKVVNGLVKSETPDEIILTTGANQETRVPRAEIEEIRPSSVSVMPAGLDQQLSAQELADLVAFLRACK
jgi:putative heme-binding domain-containing protein